MNKLIYVVGELDEYCVLFKPCVLLMLHTFTKIPNNQEMTSRNSQSILHEEANDTTRLALDKPYVNFDTQYGKYSTSVTRIRVSVYQQLQM